MHSFYYAPAGAFLRGRVLALEPHDDGLHASTTTVATVHVADSYGLEGCDAGQRIEFDCTFCWPVPSQASVVNHDVAFWIGWARSKRTGKPFAQTRWAVARDGAA
jgi:hypothetical protein